LDNISPQNTGIPTLHICVTIVMEVLVAEIKNCLI